MLYKSTRLSLRDMHICVLCETIFQVRVMIWLWEQSCREYTVFVIVCAEQKANQMTCGMVDVEGGVWWSSYDVASKCKHGLKAWPSKLWSDVFMMLAGDADEVKMDGNFFWICVYVGHSSKKNACHPPCALGCKQYKVVGREVFCTYSTSPPGWPMGNSCF